jgi:hypothetical protein
MDTLEQKIAAALGLGDTPTAADLGRLIEETDAAAAAADKVAEEARRKALDPAAPVDVSAASAAVLTGI